MRARISDLYRIFGSQAVAKPSDEAMVADAPPATKTKPAEQKTNEKEAPPAMEVEAAGENNKNESNTATAAPTTGAALKKRKSEDESTSDAVAKRQKTAAAGGSETETKQAPQPLAPVAAV